MIPQFHYKQHCQECLCCFFPTFTWLCKVNLTPRVKLWTCKFSGLQCVIPRIRFLGLIKLNVSWIPENVKGAALTYFRTSRVLCRGSCASRQNRDFLKSRPKETSGKGEWTDLNNTWFWNFCGDAHFWSHLANGPFLGLTDVINCGSSTHYIILQFKINKSS